ncbi:stage II sporulation protein M [Dethiobacter alkaliphilus]|uniref:Stage II sporulation protein M n=1 Tax=Dethiobacter alkaliphilus AHT 1 TaxID=555088 RepID=C0GE06_DETAL|nr:stage II sporulation protein M [Dethiobacter alkaliphilus]EEG78300.1 stage II sporulation protein M [Dethiobacter alkaliphilus AHT 1]
MLRNLRQTIESHVREQVGIYLVVLLVFTLGIVAGSLSVRLLGEGQVMELNDYFYGFVDYLTEQHPIDQMQVLQRSLLYNGQIVLALWLLGNLFFGFIFALGIIFYRGFTIGFTVGFLAEQNAMRGIIFSLGSVLPQNLIYVPATIFAGVFAVSLSLLLFKRRVSKKNFPYGTYFFQYTMAMLIIALAFLAGSLVETTITPVFMRAVVSVL